MFKDDILKKSFWFTKVKPKKSGHWPFGTQRYIEDLSQVIPDNYYGDDFANARLATNEEFVNTIGDATLYRLLSNGSIGAGDRASFALVTHGYNTNAILGKLRNSEINQSVYLPKLRRAPGLNLPILEHKAQLANDEPPVTVVDFIRLLRAERYTKHPEIVSNFRTPARLDYALGFKSPVMENGRVISGVPSSLNEDDNFEKLLQNISDKVGIDFRADETLGPKEMKLTAKRFFGGLDTVKRTLSPSNRGINPTGWPKRYTLSYPQENGFVDTVYGIIKCLSAIQVSRLADMSRETMVKNPTATNLPSLDLFDAKRTRIVGAASCLVASDVCHMLGLESSFAQLLSDTFKLEACQELRMIGVENYNNPNIMPLIADYHAIAVNNFATDFQVKMEDYAKSRGISSHDAINFASLLYKCDVQPKPVSEAALAEIEAFERGMRDFIDKVHEDPEDHEDEEDMPLEDILAKFFEQEAFNTNYYDPSEREDVPQTEEEEDKPSEESNTMSDEELAEVLSSFFDNPAFERTLGEDVMEESEETEEQHHDEEPAVDEKMMREILSHYFNQDEFKTKYQEDNATLSDAEKQRIFAPFFNNEEFNTKLQESSLSDADKQKVYATFFNQDEFKQKFEEQKLSDADKQKSFAPFFNKEEFKQHYVEQQLTDADKQKVYAPFFNQEGFSRDLPKESSNDADVSQSLAYFFKDKEENNSKPSENSSSKAQKNLDDFGLENENNENNEDREQNADREEKPEQTSSAKAGSPESKSKAKQKPIIKVKEPQVLHPGELPEGKLPKYRTNAGRECRDFLYEIVMEYSMDHLNATADCAKKIKATKDEKELEELKELEAENKGKSSVGSVAGAMMYALAKNRAQTTDYNAKNFPRESVAVSEIDRLTHHIIEEVKEFARLNPETVKGDNISVKKINQYFEALGNNALGDSPKVTRIQKIEKGREILRLSLKDSVYDILDSVSLPETGESAEISRLRSEALGHTAGTQVNNIDQSVEQDEGIVQGAMERGN